MNTNKKRAGARMGLVAVVASSALVLGACGGGGNGDGTGGGQHGGIVQSAGNGASQGNQPSPSYPPPTTPPTNPPSGANAGSGGKATSSDTALAVIAGLAGGGALLVLACGSALLAVRREE